MGASGFNAREIEDICAEALNLGMLSALASGDPAILQFAEATAERVSPGPKEAVLDTRTWDRQQDARAQQIADLDVFLHDATQCLDGMRAAVPMRWPTNGGAFAMKVDGRTSRKREEARAALGTRRSRPRRAAAARARARASVMGRTGRARSTRYRNATRRPRRQRICAATSWPPGRSPRARSWRRVIRPSGARR